MLFTVHTKNNSWSFNFIKFQNHFIHLLYCSCIFTNHLTPKPCPPKLMLKIPARTVKVGMDRDEKLTVNFTWCKVIECLTFFVYDRLNIPNLIHFSGTNFMQVLWCRLFLQSWLETSVVIQTVVTNMPHKHVADSAVALYGSRYIIVLTRLLNICGWSGWYDWFWHNHNALITRGSLTGVTSKT